MSASLPIRGEPADRRVGTPLLALSERGTPKPGETRSTEIPEQLAEIRALSFDEKLALLRQLGPIPVQDQPGG
jgi:hypothetical protein